MSEHQVQDGDLEELKEPGRYELTNQDREMLEFERLHWKFTGARESEISTRWGLSLPLYARRVLWLIDQPAAEEYDPVHVHRLRRLRDQRRAQRTARP